MHILPYFSLPNNNQLYNWSCWTDWLVEHSCKLSHHILQMMLWGQLYPWLMLYIIQYVIIQSPLLTRNHFPATLSLRSSRGSIGKVMEQHWSFGCGSFSNQQNISICQKDKGYRRPGKKWIIDLMSRDEGKRPCIETLTISERHLWSDYQRMCYSFSDLIGLQGNHFFFLSRCDKISRITEQI